MPICYNRFTASLVNNFTYGMFFNTIFTLLPTILIGCFDQDVNDRIALQAPKLYVQGIYQKLYSMQRFWTYFADAMFQSIVCYFFAYLTFYDSTSDPKGYESDLTVMGTTISFSAIFVVNIYAILDWMSWTYVTLIAIVPTLLIWIAYVLLYASQPASPIFGQLHRLFLLPNFYLCFFLSVIVGLFPRIAIKFFQQYYLPSDVDIMREIQTYRWKEGMTLKIDVETQSRKMRSSTTSAGGNLNDIGEVEQEKHVKTRSEPKLDSTDSENHTKSQKTLKDQKCHSHEELKKSTEILGKKTVAVNLKGSRHLLSEKDNPLAASTDGFGVAVIQHRNSNDKKPGENGGPSSHLTANSDNRTRKASFSTVMKTKVKRASQFVRRITQGPQLSTIQPPRNLRMSSLVFMGDNGFQVANTGYAFSHDSGMTDVITPTRM